MISGSFAGKLAFMGKEVEGRFILISDIIFYLN
jgi:hypothetical protein